jgi:hypothetical protein
MGKQNIMFTIIQALPIYELQLAPIAYGGNCPNLQVTATCTPDSRMLERRSKQHTDRKGLSVEWEVAVAGTAHTHTHTHITFIVLDTA